MSLTAAPADSVSGERALIPPSFLTPRLRAAIKQETQR